MNSRTTALIPANNAGIGSTDDWVPDLFGQLMKTQQEKTKASQTDRQAGHDLNDRATKLYEDYNNIQQVLQSGQVTYGSQAYVDLSTTAQDLRNQAQDLDKQHVKKIIDSAKESGQSTQLQQDAMTLAQHISPQSPPLPQNQLQTQCPSSGNKTQICNRVDHCHFDHPHDCHCHPHHHPHLQVWKGICWCCT
ncbi:hypothetical protein LTS17_001807 [Exophiala oligosperma]